MAAPVTDNIVLPDFIAEGAEKVPVTQTIRVVTGPAAEARSAQWAMPRQRFTIRQEGRSVAQMQALLDFITARGGAARGFLFRDPSDYTAVAQPVVLVDGGRQLVKEYSSGGVTIQKPVYKPQSGTVTLTGGGSLDYTTGLVTGGGAGTWSGNFYLPARFLTDQPQITMVHTTAYELETELIELFSRDALVVLPEPAPAAGYAAWYKADSLALSNGANVTAWEDSSANGYDLGQPSFTRAAKYFTNVRNSLPVVRTDLSAGEGCTLEIPASTISAAATSLTVHLALSYTTPQTGAAAFFTSFQSGGEDITLYLDATSSGEKVAWDTETSGTVYAAAAASGWQVLTFVMNKATPLGTLYRNGVSAGTGAFPAGGVDLGPDQILLFTTGASNWWVGDVGEILIYPTAQSAGDRQDTVDYLMDRWAI